MIEFTELWDSMSNAERQDVANVCIDWGYAFHDCKEYHLHDLMRDEPELRGANHFGELCAIIMEIGHKDAIQMLEIFSYEQDGNELREEFDRAINLWRVKK
jgi:hypothetical protein